MLRFVDLRGQDLGVDFAWWDTCLDSFEQHSGEMGWTSFKEFENDYYGDNINKYKQLAPQWVYFNFIAEE